MSHPSPVAPTGHRVGLREIAQAAGVSLMTVSLALHNSPKISGPTRRRVRDIAEKLGYRPDPELSRLMIRLRSSRVSQRGTVIGLIDLRRDLTAPQHPYNMRLRSGIETRAQQLGFGIDQFRLQDYGMDIGSLLRVVRQRGITGGIFLPAEKPLTFPRSVKWDGLSIVSATTSVLFPRFHRVAPNQLHNILTLLDTLTARGFKRIGLVITENFEERSAHIYSLVFTARGHQDRILILPSMECVETQASAQFREWLEHRQPDLIIAQDPAPIARLLAAGGGGRRRPRAPLVSLSTRNDNRFPFQDELPDSIGASAADLLAGMMANHETGIPLHPRVTTIDGVFRHGRWRTSKPGPAKPAVP